MNKKHFAWPLWLLMAGLLASCSTVSMYGAGRSASTSSMLAQQAVADPHYALLLPLHGALGQQGQAVRDGFFAAYYQYAKSSDKPVSIEIYDTSGAGDIKNIYSKAMADGATLIIGPLEKAKVERLANGKRVEVLTLALNYSSKLLPLNFYEFGYSPTYEALKAAEKAWSLGSRNALIIYHRDAWSQNVAKAFTKRWQKLGGANVGELKVSASSGVMDQIQAYLKKHTVEISKDVKKFKFDVVFMVNPVLEARSIVPLLRFYGATAVPIYTISSIYNGSTDKFNNKDLDGVRFADIPWFVNDAAEVDAIRQQFKSIWASKPENIRLYALGMDAFNLTLQLDRLNTSTDATYHGVTGILNLQNQRINHELVWAQFMRGRVVPL